MEDWAQVVEFDSLIAPGDKEVGEGWSRSGTQKGVRNGNDRKGWRRTRSLKDIGAKPPFASDQCRALTLGCS